MSSAFGRYRLLERLGQGGMAEVFKAKSYGVEGFEKILVIKRILPELSCRQDFVDMFIHEAKLAVRLSHANIVQVFDLGKAASGEAGDPKQPDAYYMAMEYVHGMDLATVLARCRRQRIALSVEMSVYVASEIAKGLDHAHRRRDERARPLGIVHRDVSPQNVLLSFEGEVKVTDFGVAKARGALDTDAPEDTRTKRLQGKFGYMSPEQSRGESVDARSDLFSLGIIVYECVAGVNPFSAPTTFETLRRVQACEYPPLSLLRPDAPAELVVILKTLMAKNQADRYPDAGRAYEALLAFLYGQGKRYGAHDLAELLSRFRETADAAGPGAIPEPMLETEGGNPQTERTPVEGPSGRAASSVRVAAGLRSIAIDRAAEMGERREVTAVVIELSRHISGGAVDKAATIMERWGGRVVRREVGHIAALFGLLDPDGRDTEMATRCALVALRSLEPAHPPGIGLHVGRIHVSSSGEPTEDDRLGSLVDAARDLARLHEGQAAMSTQAMRQVKALFEFEPLSDGDRAASTVPALRVREARGPGESLGRFVGRKDELRRIGVVLALAAKRRARVLTIRGDQGVGKTRLLLEVERRLRKGGYDVGFHIATCPPQGNGFPLSGVVCMLQVLCGTTEVDAPDRILALEPRLRALGLQGDEVQAVLMALGAVTTIVGDAGALLCRALTRMVHSLCGDRPHTFAWDVAHAMDHDSYALLGEVLRGCGQTRVVFAFVARAGFSHPLEKTEGHVDIDLGDFAPPEVERLVALRLGVEAVPDELLRFVLERAGGHPLFVVEVVKALVEGSAVSVAERRVVSTRLVGQDLALPKTLRGLVGSRVARLLPEEKATLQAAAILGDPIDLAVLSSMTGQPMPALERSIAAIAARDFVVHTGPAELRFTSPLVREVVADALTPEAAREMHAAAGRALEVTLREPAWEHPARIAGHLYEAGDRERAAVYFAKSGERRLAMHQLEAAARDWARAIALADAATRAPEELVTWLERLAAAVRLVRVCPGAKELCDRVVEQADRAGGCDSRVRARVAAGHVLAAINQIEHGRVRLAEAMEIASSGPELVKPVLLADVDVAIRQGDFTRALVRLDQLRSLARACSDEQEEHRVALHLSQAHGAMGDRVTALANLDEAERLLPQDQTAVLERVRVRALVDYFTRDFQSAARRSEEAIDLARELGLAHEVMLNMHHLGHVLVYLDDLPRAYGAIQQSLALCCESGDERFANYNRMLLAFLDGINETVDGERLLRQGIAYAESKQFTWDVIGGHRLLAKLMHRLGKRSAAREQYEKARELAVAAGHRLVADDCERALEELMGSRETLAQVNSDSAL